MRAMGIYERIRIWVTCTTQFNGVFHHHEAVNSSDVRLNLDLNRALLTFQIGVQISA